MLPGIADKIIQYLLHFSLIRADLILHGRKPVFQFKFFPWQIHQKPSGLCFRKFHKAKKHRRKLYRSGIHGRQLQQGGYHAVHPFRFPYDNLGILLSFFLFSGILQAFRIGPDNTERRFHLMGKIICQFFPLRHPSFFPLHLCLKTAIDRLQPGKGILQVIRHRIQILRKHAELICALQLTGPGKIQPRHTSRRFIQFIHRPGDKTTQQVIHQQDHPQHQQKPDKKSGILPHRQNRCE